MQKYLKSLITSVDADCLDAQDGTSRAAIKNIWMKFFVDEKTLAIHRLK